MKKMSNSKNLTDGILGKVFGIMFILTGIFAILGGLYTWGQGNIFDQNELLTVLIPWADIILTGPISIACGYGILKKYFWGTLFGLVTSGIYVFGSILVFITLYWNKDYPLFLLVPAFSGLIIGIGFIILTFQKEKQSNTSK